MVDKGPQHRALTASTRLPAPKPKFANPAADKSDEKPSTMHKRHHNTRNYKVYSLQNLLQIQTAQEELILTVVKTPKNYLMKSSRERNNQQTIRIAAHASTKLFTQKATP